MAKLQDEGHDVEADDIDAEFEWSGEVGDGVRRAIEIEVDPVIRHALEAELARTLGTEQCFDTDGRFIVEGERADGWEDAQRFAARAIDAHERLRAHLHAHRSGLRGAAPLFAGMNLADVWEMARGAVVVAIHGRMPGVKSLSPLFRTGRRLALRRYRESGRFDGVTRARLAYLMATVNGETAARQIAETIGADEGPRSLVSILREPEQAARALAGLGDANAARAADIIGAMVRLLLGGGDDPLSAIKIAPKAQNKEPAADRVEDLAAAIGAMHDPRPDEWVLGREAMTADELAAGWKLDRARERAGAAFLLGAIKLGVGPSFQYQTLEAGLDAALTGWTARTFGREPEDSGDVGRREPLLQWLKPIKVGLHALGHAKPENAVKHALEKATNRAQAARDAEKFGEAGNVRKLR